MRQAVTATRPLLDRGDLRQVVRQMADAVLALKWPRDAVQAPPDLPLHRQPPRPWLIGIHRGGVQVARELADAIELSEGWRPATGTLDITLYRDDTWLKGPVAVEAETELPGDPTGQRIVLCDDVLYTGRTVRAALSVLLDFGRPEAVRLAVLVDRGGRELPVAADVCGHKLDAPPSDSVELGYDAQGRIADVHFESRG